MKGEFKLKNSGGYPSLRFIIDGKGLKVFDTTRQEYRRFVSNANPGSYLTSYEKISDRDTKLLMINLGLHFYENSSYFFKIRNSPFALSERRIDIQKKNWSFVPPEMYFDMLTKHMSEDWYVSLTHDNPIKQAMEGYRAGGTTNYPKITILLKSQIQEWHKPNKDSRRKLRDILAYWLHEGHNLQIENDDERLKETKNNIFGEAILLQTGSFSHDHYDELMYNQLVLVTDNIMTHAYVVGDIGQGLKTGVYSIEAFDVQWKASNSGLSLVITDANIIKEFPDVYDCSHQFNKRFETYHWDSRKKLRSFLNRSRRWIKREIDSFSEGARSLVEVIIAILLIVGAIASVTYVVDGIKWLLSIFG